MRADRLLALLLLLQNRGRMTAPELADELEVSVRTVYRDVDALAASGVPVYAERGPAGGFRLMDGYRTRLTGLTDDEADSLALAGMPAAAADLGLGAELVTAQLKLGAALPAGLGERSRRIQERFLLDAEGWFRAADPAPLLPVVADAVWRRRVLRAHYRRWGGEVHRELHPLGLVLKAGNWYLVATADGAVRTYRVSRFLDVTAEDGDEPSERPAGFDLAAYWQAASQDLQARVLRGTARVRVSLAGLRLLPALFGAAGARAVEAAGGPDADGRRVVDLDVETLPVAVSDLLRLGLEAEVLGPPELRAELARTVTGLAQRYA
ncbi:WYL domain-containing protein [Streptomyces sp. NBC_01381]|uniref:helix-turn-helix transcriptional regulator n=1 Tax=Streptomyces sp. NBC_01381 TaxID=2903845 RepID=UPI0022569B7C|nr:WYL domain-containing protein [Streptomyces sp. NBC_01381]MCX4668806.1 WYL domain-containing protein [Streptomyces sp. NBC_01381]